MASSAGVKRPAPGSAPSAQEAAPSVRAGAPMSALEQMELFEKRLKVQAKRAPEKAPTNEAEAMVDSNHARSMNKQMDWDCSGCGAFNFARVVVCYSCKRHVDDTTKYISNRLQDLKAQRFATVFQDDKDLSRFAPVPAAPDARPDGSSGNSDARARASFSS